MLSSTRGFDTSVPRSTGRAARRSRRFSRGIARWGVSGVVGLLLLAILMVVAAAGPLLVGNPMRMDVPVRLHPPSAEHAMGTDEFGRDILTRVVHGARISLGAGVGVVFVGLGIGLTVG